MKKYFIKEIFYSIQGEGFYSGLPAIFVRFSGCNFWSGIDSERDKSICKFCDTDFNGSDGINGGNYSLFQLIELLNAIKENTKCKFIVLTGGEPALQVDVELVVKMRELGFYISMETNGSIDISKLNLDWVTVSPKSKIKLEQKSGNELKLVFPQDGFDLFEFYELKFDHFFLQPKFDFEYQKNRQICLEYCLANPKWRLSLQIHKILDIP